jgi:tetratricopeptide (TPR) repeat protein
MVCMRKWGWRGAGIAAGVAVAGGLGAAGQWWGGLLGAALIAAGGFVAPELSDWLKDRRSRSAALDQVSSAVLIQKTPRPRGGDAFWLRPEQRVVEFIDRPELVVLREWCTGPEEPGLMLVTGAGGVGKTRLALRLAEELGGQGWLCRMVSAGGESGVAAAVARAARRRGVLLIVDYAETRPGVADLLRDIAGDSGGRLRVLLIARGEGEWWARLKGSPDDKVRALVAEAGLIRVGVLAGGLDGAEVVRAAVPEFARAVGAAVPEVVEVSIPAEAVPVLVLHAAALLTVLDARDHPGAGPARVVADEGVLARLLGRETAFWLASAAAAGLSGAGGIDSVTAGQVVAVACLFAAADESDAGRLLRRVPALADAPEGTVLRIARWLLHVYPADRPRPQAVSAHWWGSLQPDLLAERHVVTEFADNSAFAAACLRDLTAVQAAGALTVLARACTHRPQAPALIASALRVDLPGLGVPAVGVAVQTSGPVGSILADVADGCDATLETLVRIEEAIPYPTIALARADMVLTARINSMLPADASKADVARWRDSLGIRFSQLGRPADALPATQEAVAAYRELATVNPDRYRPDLAASLSNLGVRFWELGRPADALPATQEAVAAYRELAAVNPDRYRPDLAASLSNLGVRFWELGCPADALAATQEAVAAYRELVAVNPDRYRPDLAASLSNLDVWFSGLGHPADALAATQEAVAAYRELVAVNPDRYRPDLARSLSNLGVRFSELGRPAEAEEARKEALAIQKSGIQ